MKTLIGSRAIRHFFPEFKREGDWDYIVDVKPEWTPGCVNVEYHLNPVFKDYEYRIMMPNDLYTLKISHAIGWDLNWDKHVYDIQFLKSKGCQLNKELFDKLYAYWNTIHEPNKRSKLDMTAEDFFDNAVDCEHNHDFLHTLLNPTPTYTKVLIGEVEVGEEKFNLLTHSEKCALVQEEVCIMAAERYKGLGWKHRYGRMLKKFILNHAPIWEAIFILENFVELHSAPYNFMEEINSKLTQLKLNTLI